MPAALMIRKYFKTYDDAESSTDSVFDADVEGLKKRLSNLQAKYNDLVWYARSDFPRNHKLKKPVENKYKEDIKKLRECDDNWQHGFNSGMLAATRLFDGYVDKTCSYEDSDPDFIERGNIIRQTRHETIQQAEDEFPMLDT